MPQGAAHRSLSISISSEKCIGPEVKGAIGPVVKDVFYLLRT